MAYLTRLNNVLQQGLGVEGRIIGLPYNVYRFGPGVVGSVIGGIPNIVGFRAFLDRASKKDIENEIGSLVCFVAKCDNRKLMLGDFLVGTDERDTATYVFAQYRQLKKSIFIRAEALATFERMSELGGLASQQPQSGAVAGAGYSGDALIYDTVLTLHEGYSFVAQGASLAQVPVGLQPGIRFSDASQPKLSTSEYRERFTIYVPDLPGVQLLEKDRIIVNGIDRFEIAVIYSSGVTGFTGNICICEKLAVT